MSGVIQWTLDHKFLLLGVVTVCLFVSTVALAVKSKGSNEPSFKMAKATAAVSSTPVTEDNFYRLPRHVVPKNYKLTLHPDILKNTFNGTVIIKIQVLQPTQNITLHSNKLSINSLKLNNDKVKSWRLSEDEREYLTVHLGSEIPVENYELEIKFSGKLDNGIVGFYASKLKNGR